MRHRIFTPPPRSTVSKLRYRVKTLVFIAILIASGMAAGAGVTYAQLHIRMHRTANTSLFLAGPTAAPVPAMLQQVESSAIAVHDVEIQQLARENQASISDRKILHDQIYALTQTEAADFNRMSGRMDVGEARIMTAMWVFGGLWSTGMGILLFFHFDERFKVRSTGKA
jgi:hypothetical protein